MQSLSPSVVDIHVGLSPTSDGVVTADSDVLPRGRLKSVVVEILDAGTGLRKGDCYAETAVTRGKNSAVILECGSGYVNESGLNIGWNGDFPLKGTEYLGINARCFLANVKLNAVARVEVSP